MALKRSGVRASSAPFQKLVPHRKPRPLARFLFGFLVRVLVFLGLLAGNSRLLGQSKTGIGDFRPEAVVLVWVMPSDKARIAIAYDTRVTSKETRAFLQRLSRITGWEIAPDLRVTQERSRQGAPVTTGIEVTLLHAPQTTGIEPLILPYLMALQNRKRVEVVFMTGTSFVAHEQESSVHPDLTLRRQVFETGTVRYEAEITEHQLPLAPPVFGQVLMRPTAKPAPTLKPRNNDTKRSSVVIYVLMVLGVTFLGIGAYVYLGGNRTPASRR